MTHAKNQTTALLETVLEAMDQGFIAWSEDYKLVAWNQLFLDFWQYPSHLIRVGVPLIEVLEFQATLGTYGEGEPKELAAVRMQSVIRDFKGAAAHNAAAEYVDKSPSGKWLQIKRRLVKGLGFVTCATDITEKVASERAVNLMHDNIDSFADSVVMADTDGTIIYTNNRYHEIYPDAPSRAEIIGLRQEDLLRRSVATGLIAEPLAQSDPEAWVRKKVAARQVNGTSDWESRHTNGRIYQIRQQRDDISGSIIITADITERKKSEDALKLANETLEVRVQERTRDLEEQVRLREIDSRAKSDFLANMSHELRTPLNAVIGFSETMRHEIFGPLGSAKYAEYAEDIHMAGNHLLELINDVLDLSKVEAGQWELHEEDVDLVSTLNSMVRMVREQASNKEIELVLAEPAGGAAIVYCDERAVKQISLNLLTNAVKFTKPGGRVEVTTEVMPDQGVAISISDNGIGIAAEDIPKILSPFGQAASAETRGHEGTGLGLSLAKSLTELHDGSFSVTSELGVGTTVTARFPPERYRGRN